jgi:hypothetical protein
MKSEQAVEIARDALIWLAGRPEDVAGFMAASGISPDALRARAADPELLGFVLEYLLGSDARVLEYTAQEGLAPTAPAEARAALPGGRLPNWT